VFQSEVARGVPLLSSGLAGTLYAVVLGGSNCWQARLVAVCHLAVRVC